MSGLTLYPLGLENFILCSQIPSHIVFLIISVSCLQTPTCSSAACFLHTCYSGSVDLSPVSLCRGFSGSSRSALSTISNEFLVVEYLRSSLNSALSCNFSIFYFLSHQVFSTKRNLWNKTVSALTCCQWDFFTTNICCFSLSTESSIFESAARRRPQRPSSSSLEMLHVPTRSAVLRWHHDKR